ncbi:MAG: class I SAM-dependent methyltransferase [Alphaproteobacteria bacterium]|nr:class I SAM-dependent methyltransferase [Alphaproteobacteria bacterium]
MIALHPPAPTFSIATAERSGGPTDGAVLPAKAKVAAAYNAAADRFDAGPLGFWARTGRRTVSRLALGDGAMVLDVGCGTGASALPAAERIGPSGRVIGVDLAEELLRIARTKAVVRGLDNVEFHPGDMEQLGYPDGHFDAVVCVFALFFATDMERQLAELWRMVRPGGQLAVTTWGPRMFEPAASRWRCVIDHMCPALSATGNPWDRITDTRSVRKLFENAGVPNVKVEAENARQALTTPEDWWTVVLGSGLRGIVNQMDEKTAARTRSANVGWVRENFVTAIETNVIYAVASKPAN